MAMAHKDSSGKKEKMFILEVAPVYLPKMYADRPVCQNNGGVQELTGADMAGVQELIRSEGKRGTLGSKSTTAKKNDGARVCISFTK